MIRSSRTLALFLSATFAYGTLTPGASAQTPPSNRGDYRGKNTKPTSTGVNGGTSENSAKARRAFIQVRSDRSRGNTGGGNNQQGGGGSGNGQTGGGGSGNGTGTSGGGLGSPSLPPTGLNVVSAGDGAHVHLGWTDNSLAESGFEVLRQTLSGGTWGAQVSLAVGANVTSLVDAPGVGTYQYSVRAQDALGGSAFTGWMQVAVADIPPAAPTGVQAADLGNGRDASITWTDASSNEASFEVERQRFSGGAWVADATLTAASNVTSLVDSPGVGSFRYHVRAINAMGASAYSDWATPTIADIAPSAPSSLAAVDLGNRAQVRLTWGDNSSNESGFEAVREALTGTTWGSATTITASANATQLVDAPGLGTFRYRLRAVNGVGASAYTSTVQVTVSEIAPAAPSAIAATDLGNGSQARVAWADNSTNESGFTVIRETQSGSSWINAVTVTTAANATSYVDAPGVGTFRYRVRATNAVGSSAEVSATVTVVQIAPAAPSNLAATDSGTGSQVALQWADNSTNEGSFELQRETLNGTVWGSTTSLNAAANAVALTDAPGVGTFHYRVRATNSAGSSAYTGWTQVTVAATTPPPPAAPSGLAVADNGDGTASLTWSDNSSNETGFELERSPAFASQTIVGSNVTTSIDAPGAGSFMYHVRALGAGGNSVYTAWVSVNITDNTGGGGGGGGGGSGGGGSGGVGWTDIVPPADARVIYVSSSTGNNANPGTQGAPVRTIAAGYALLRDGYPDQLLLRRGDTFTEGAIYWNKSGRSAGEPTLLGAFGTTTDPRPVWVTGTDSALNLSGANPRFIFVQSIEMTPGTDSRGGGGVGRVGNCDTITFEDCYIHNYTNNVAFLEGNDSDMCRNVTFRRCTIADAWQAGGQGTRGQGFMLGHAPNFTVEECIVIGNGWQNGGQPRSTEAHNFYTYAVMDNLTIRDCIVANGSFLGISANGNNGTFTGNLCVGNVVGIGARPQNCAVENNVVTECAWPGAGWDTQGIDSRTLWAGSHTELNLPGPITIRNNLVSNNPGVAGSGNGAIQYNSSNPGDSRAVRQMTGNVVHGWDGACLTVYSSGGGYDPVTFSGNTLVANAGRPVVNFNPGSASGFSFSANRYFRSDAGGAWFSGSGSRTAAQWASFTGESGATTTAPAFLDTTRSVGTYNASLGGPATSAAFLARARQQRRYNWDENYTATTANAWIRAGFNMP